VAAVLIMLAGGSGNIALDDTGCPNNLVGNTLIRTLSRFHEQGFATAIVDAPTGTPADDGLGGLRVRKEHAQDLGRIVMDVRARSGAPVVIAGSSRGTISAVNAASRLSGASAPDAVVLASPITQGREGGYKAWVAQSVFDLPLQSIEVPVLVMVHELDGCIRTPPSLAPRVVERIGPDHARLLVFSGGHSQGAPPRGLQACSGQAPHGFGGQDRDAVDAISAFVRSAITPGG
jgi:hypothetical protein